jgi:hypothetical protein
MSVFSEEIQSSWLANNMLIIGLEAGWKQREKKGQSLSGLAPSFKLLSLVQYKFS